MRVKYSLILLLLLASTSELYAQLNATLARHETDAQTSTTLTLSGNLAANYICTGGCLANWSMTVGGVPATIIAVAGAIGSNQVVISFTPAVGIGQAVVVNHTNDGIVNNIAGLISQNNRVIICSDFAWESTNTPTPPCAPVDPITKMAFSVKRGARNSSAWASTTLKIRAHWVANGAVPFNDLNAYESNNAGIATPNTYFIAGDAASSAYIYPANDPVCGYTATYRILINNGVTTSCAFTNPNQQVPYASHNNDDTGVGADVILAPNVVGSDMVCLGSNANMRFRDNTDLNCNPTTPPVPTNDAIRWVRVIYGSTDLGGGNTATSNIPNIVVAGTPVTNATGNLLFPGGYIPATTPFGTPDAFGVVTVTAPVTTARGLLDLITTSSPTGQVVGQKFWVRLDYWNVCNPYDGAGDGLNLRKSVENEIEIITKPVALTTIGASLCFDATNTITGINFTATNGLPGRTAVNWYRNLAAVSTATRMTNPNGVNSLTFPASAYGAQGGIGGNFTTNNASGRYMSVWATQVIGATNSCESDPVEIVIVQQPRIDLAADAPNAPSGNASVCNGPPGTNEVYTTNATTPKTIAATTSTNGAIINLPLENIWSVANYAATVSNTPATGNSTTVTFNISPQPNPTDPGEVQVRRGYVTTTNIPVVSPLPAPFTLPTYNINPQACLNANVPLTVTVFGQSDGGTISGTTTICNGASTGNMTVTGHRGAVLQWERSFNAGAFIAIAATGGVTTFSEVPPNGPGVYKYRVLVQNQNATGPCASATTIVANQNTITVNPVPGKPTITQGAGSNGLAICLGDQTVLQSDNPGAIAGVTYRWFKAPDMVTPVQSGASNTLTLTTIAQSGDYSVQIIGPATSNCPSIVSDPVTVTISGLPTAVVSGGGAACDGNPAPDIIWTFSGATSYNFTIDRPSPLADIVETNYASNIYTLTNQIDAGNYQIIALSNAITGCVATVAGRGGPGVVTSSGGSPDLDTPAPSISPAEVCIAGTSATDPVLSLKLTVAFANTNGFILNYTINGGANIPKTFNTDASGLPTAPISFAETALNVVGTHTIRLVSIQSPSGCLRPVGLNLTYIVRPLPVIGTPPVAAEVCEGGNTSYVVAASTAGATSTNIQWQISTTGVGGPFTNLTNTAPYSNVTTTTLSITGATAALNGNFYRAVATGVFPSSFSCPVNSTAVALTVRPYATITVQPPTRVLCSGENTTFGVTANVAGPSTITSYQWQISTAGVGGPYSNLTNVAPYSNVTTATMNITGATTALSGNFYRVLITTTGTCALPSNPGPLTVNPLPVSNAISPIVCEDIIHIPGNPSVGAGQATNVDLTQFDVALSDLPGAPVEKPVGFDVLYFQDLGHTVQITTPTTISAGEQIFTRVINTSSLCFTDRTITFTVRPQPVPSSFTDQICEDSPPGSLIASGIDLTSYEATVTGGVGNRNVEWYKDNTLATLIPAGSLPNQEENFSISATTTLFAKIIDTTPGTPGCHSVAELKLEYQPRPNANTIRDGAGVPIGATYTVCASNNLVFLQIDPTINPGSTYSWNVPTPPPLPTDPGYFELLTGTNGFFIILRFPSLNPSPGIPISVTETLGTAACAGTTIGTSIIVDGSPAAPVITGPTTVCSNSSVIYTVPFVAGDTYSWTVPPGATITSFPITNTITVQISTFSGNVTVTVANSTGCVAPPSTPLPVTVITKPVMTSPPTNILCSGQAPDDVHTLTASLGGTTYRWEIISISGFVSGANVGDTDGSVAGSNTPGAANIDSRNLTNTSGVNADVIYRVIPVSPPTAGVYCEGNQQNVRITIQPEPNLLLSPKAVCSDEPANYEIRLATAGLPSLTVFSWSAPVMSDGSTQGTSGTNIPAGPTGTVHINDAFLNTSPAAITATYTITAVSGAGCPSNQAVADRQVVITINPKPLVSTTLDKPVCSDEAIALTLNTQAGSAVAGTYNIVGQTIDPLLIPHGSNAALQNNVAASYLANDKFTNTSGGPLLVTYLVNARSTGPLGSCLGPDQLITITINPGPATNSVTDEVCSDVAGGNTYVEDLTSLQPLVNPDGTLIFEWYSDAAATVAIGTPSAYPLQDKVAVYVKVHNGVGTCAKIQPVEYVVNPTPAVTASITSNYNGFSVRCIGAADGTITADLATLGSPNYTYSVDGSTFFTGKVFNGLAASNNPFIVTVRDAKGCTATSTPMSLTQPPIMVAPILVTSDYNGRQLSCPGEDDGQITVAASGGTGSGYFYKIIETGATNLTGVFNGLPQGVYTVIVTDKSPNNCTITTSSVTITPPPVISASATMSAPASCNGAIDGVVKATASGGTLIPPVPPNNYTFTISPGGASNNTGIFTGLASSGVPYVVAVKDDNGCTVQSNGVVVTQPAPISAFISVTSAHPGGSAISCFGANDAQLTVTANGGNGGYGYVLNVVTPGAANTTGDVAGIYDDVHPGVYSATVADSRGCNITSGQLTVAEPADINVQQFITAAITCNGEDDGQIRLVATGGTGAFTYTRTAGPPVVTLPEANGTGIFSGLSEFNYPFSVNDINGCTKTLSIMMTDPDPVVLSGAVISDYFGADIKCPTSKDGIIQLSTIGGNGNYSYTITAPVLAPPNVTGGTSGIFNGLGAGTYTFHVVDPKGCNDSEDVTIVPPTAVTISAPTKASYNGQDVTCTNETDGVITALAGNGTPSPILPAYTYVLSPSSNVTGSNDGSFEDVGPGTYTLTTFDANGCSATSASITINPYAAITFPAAADALYNGGREITCKGVANGQITSTPNGGAGGWTTYAISPTPGTVINAGNGVFSGLPAGSYTITALDANACQGKTALVTVHEPDELVASASAPVGLTCFNSSDASVSVSAVGGTANYIFSITTSPVTISPAVPSQHTFTGLGPNAGYVVTVTDLNNCTDNVTVNPIAAPSQPVITASVTSKLLTAYHGQDITCFGADDAIITALHTPGTGTGSLTYALSGNTSGQFTGIFSQVGPGLSQITATDFNGCPAVPVDVPVTEPARLVATIVSGLNYGGFEIKCFNEANGRIIVTTTGGTGAPLSTDFKYMLLQAPSSAVDLTNGDVRFNNLRANEYEARVQDINSCTAISNLIELEQPDLITVDISITSNYGVDGTDISCNGANDGEVSVAATIVGGTGLDGGGAGAGIVDYRFILNDKNGVPLTDDTNPGYTSGIFTGLTNVRYTITAIDSNVCTQRSFPVTLVQPSVLQPGFIGSDQNICINQATPALTTFEEFSTPFGGNGSYQFQWKFSTVSSTGPFTSVPAGGNAADYLETTAPTVTTYYVREVSLAGAAVTCPSVISNPVTVTVNELPTADITLSRPDPICEGGSFLVNMNFLTGALPFTYTYTTLNTEGATGGDSGIGGNSLPIFVTDYQAETTFTLTDLVDRNGCIATSSPVAQRTVGIIKFSADFDILGPNPQCSGTPFIFQHRNDNNVTYTFSWPDGTSRIVVGDGSPQPDTVRRSFTAFDPGQTAELPVLLKAEVAGCNPKTTSEIIKLYPAIIPNIVVTENKLCSGSTVQITNNTLGGDIHNWTITRTNDGQVEPGFPITDASALNKAFVINNTTGFNPATYQIMYNISNDPGAGNGNCANSTSVTVDVYTAIIAKIGSPKDPVQPIQRWGETDPGDNGVMGVDPVDGKNYMQITFGNASTPTPPATGIEYTWTFSNNNANTPPETFGDTHRFYNYKNPGVGKRAMLTVVNLAAIGNVPGGCSATDQFIFEIEIPPIIAGFTLQDYFVCLPDSIVTTNLSTPLFNKWSIVNESKGGTPIESNDFQPVFHLTEPGRYRITLKVRNPDFPDQEIYYVHAEDTVVDAYLPPDAAFITSPFPKVFIPDQLLRTDNRSQTAFDDITSAPAPIYYQWDFGDGEVLTSSVDPTMSDPNFSPTHRFEIEDLDGVPIRLVAFNDHGPVNARISCTDTATVIVFPVAAGTSKVPNAFTPNLGGPSGGVVNEDGTTINDVFLPITKGVKEFQMQIFDRWGNLVFESLQQNKGWDGYDRKGNLMPAGVYVYKLVLRMGNDQRTTQVGDVTLIR